jgi:ankyrin repeat protein
MTEVASPQKSPFVQPVPLEAERRSTHGQTVEKRVPKKTEYLRILLDLAHNKFHEAIYENNLEEVMRQCLGGACVNETLAYGFTPLSLAIKKHSFSVAMYLISVGADVTQLDYLGRTLLHDAAASGAPQDLARALAKGMPLDYLNVRGPQGYTPLHLCACIDAADVARVLLELHADTKAKTNAGYTALQLANKHKSLGVAALLRDAALLAYLFG